MWRTRWETIQRSPYHSWIYGVLGDGSGSLYGKNTRKECDKEKMKKQKKLQMGPVDEYEHTAANAFTYK